MQSSRHQKLTCSTRKYLTNITLPPPSHTHTHAHIFPRLLKHVQESLNQQEYEIEKRWVFSWDLKADKVWACCTEKGRLYQMEGPMKEKARCPWILLRLFGIWTFFINKVKHELSRKDSTCKTMWSLWSTFLRRSWPDYAKFGVSFGWYFSSFFSPLLLSTILRYVWSHRKWMFCFLFFLVCSLQLIL